MEYHSLTELLSNHRASRRFFMSLPIELQLELHKHDDSVKSASELKELVGEINRSRNYDSSAVFPHEYSLY